ncbi:uncharacterized protein [Solanum lycopersicum]|uniref:uncharacterized protein n=1 Tax=Solanum lycopersicum TaxID=4081 RepID=UPI00374A78AC
MAIDFVIGQLILLGDSNLLILQAQGEWITRDLKILTYIQYVKYLSKRFGSIKFRYIPGFDNKLADALATLALMLPYPRNTYITPLMIQDGDQHGYCNTVEKEIDVLYKRTTNLNLSRFMDAEKAEKIMNVVHARGMDVIGRIEPKASNGDRFILVAID